MTASAFDYIKPLSEEDLTVKIRGKSWRFEPPKFGEFLVILGNYPTVLAAHQGEDIGSVDPEEDKRFAAHLIAAALLPCLPDGEQIDSVMNSMLNLTDFERTRLVGRISSAMSGRVAEEEDEEDEGNVPAGGAKASAKPAGKPAAKKSPARKPAKKKTGR